MAQFASEPLISVVSEGIPTLVPSTLASIPSVPLLTPGFHPLVPRTLLHSMGHGQTYAPPDLVTESILMTTTHALEAL